MKEFVVSLILGVLSGLVAWAVTSNGWVGLGVGAFVFVLLYVGLIFGLSTWDWFD